MGKKQDLPPSAVRWTDPLVNAATAAIVYAFFRTTHFSNTMLAIFITVAVTLVMSAIEIHAAPWRKTKRPHIPFATTIKRAGVKFVGVMAGFILAVIFWTSMPGDTRNYAPHFAASLALLLAFVPPVIAAVILFTEWRLGPLEDQNWHMGMLALGQWKKVDGKAVVTALLGWLVRIIFLPLNFEGLAKFIDRFRGLEGHIFNSDWAATEYLLLNMLSALLVAAIVPGYLFSSRLLGTSIKSVDHTISGWLATMVCYPPLLAVVFLQGLNFYPHMERAPWGQPWQAELAGWPALAAAVGLAVLVFEILHYWGEAAFGLRASNLSNRGIITNGPFRFCKHPIYFVKCVNWLLWMPFLAGETVFECIKLTFFWLCTCAIYMGRAYAEERLLHDDKDYAAYALWMDRHGMFAWLGKAFPFLSFGWRQERWVNY